MFCGQPRGCGPVLRGVSPGGLVVTVIQPDGKTPLGGCDYLLLIYFCPPLLWLVTLTGSYFSLKITARMNLHM